MTTSETTDRTRHTDRWSATRFLRSSFALTVGVLAALIFVVGLLYLLFGSGGGVTVVEAEVEDVIIEDVSDGHSAPVAGYAMEACPDDACIMPMPRRPRIA